MVDYAKQAQEVVKELNSQRKKLTTAQIRKFLAGVNMISNKILAYQAEGRIKGDVLPEDIISELQYLKIKFIYQCGRFGKRGPVEKFNNVAKITERIDDIGNSKSKFESFSKYIEAIVAYHKYEGGD
ncbi:MAG: type III-A CRISPR-associated protein Csm2 [Clostridia bacterium]|nr:type III-A CRISPR-associated protein Csm2 [Clostridia bacterium]